MNLSLYMIDYYKKVIPDGIAIIGGPNFTLDHKYAREWLINHKNIDFVVEREGEVSCENILSRLIENDFDIKKTKKESIKGVFFIDTKENLFYEKELPLKELDEIPSPYLNGSLDEFITGDVNGFKLFPMFEGVRGCPFTCSFCHSGDKWYQKIRYFSTGRLFSEFDYVCNLYKTNNQSISAFLMTDLNFGSFPRDEEVAKKLGENSNKYGFPISLMTTTGKTKSERVLRAISHFEGISMTMSVQSLDDEVLSHIKRKNFPLTKYVEYQNVLKKRKTLSKSDTIMGLPMDTREKHLETLEKLLKVRIDVIDTFSYMMLKGTHDERPEIRKKYNFKTKWRLLPGNFSKYNNAKDIVFEFEEIVISSNTFSFEDYQYCRRIHLLLATILNWTIFSELKKILLEKRLSLVLFLVELEKYIKNLKNTNNLKSIYKEFKNKTENELFDNQEELIKFYSRDNNYQLLVDGIVGENLLQNFRLKFLFNINELTNTIHKIYKRYLKKNNQIYSESDHNLFTLLNSKSQCIFNLFNGNHNTRDNSINFTLDFNFYDWLEQDNLRKTINDYKIKKGIRHKVYYTENQINEYKLLLPQNKTMKDDEKARIIYRLGTKKIMPIFVRS